MTTFSASPSAIAASWGLRGSVPLGGILANCNCTLDVADPLFLPASLQFSVPDDLAIVGYELSVQRLGRGTACADLLTFSNTYDFTLP